MRALGALLLVAACTLAGVQRTRALRFHRCCVDDALAALRYLDAELCAEATPLPEIFSMLAQRRDSVLQTPFATLAEKTAACGGEGLGALWSECWLRDTRVSLSKNERLALARLGAVLGRYGAQEQARALRGSIAFFEAASARAQKRSADGARISVPVGLTLGLMLAAALV